MIPLSQIGMYLESADILFHFGMACVILGRHAECIQIIIFRDRKQLHCTELQFNDLRVNGINESALYVIYEEDYEKSVREVLSYVK